MIKNKITLLITGITIILRPLSIHMMIAPNDQNIPIETEIHTKDTEKNIQAALLKKIENDQNFKDQLLFMALKQQYPQQVPQSSNAANTLINTKIIEEQSKILDKILQQQKPATKPSDSIVWLPYNLGINLLSGIGEEILAHSEWVKKLLPCGMVGYGVMQALFSAYDKATGTGIGYLTKQALSAMMSLGIGMSNTLFDTFGASNLQIDPNNVGFDGKKLLLGTGAAIISAAALYQIYLRLAYVAFLNHNNTKKK